MELDKAQVESLLTTLVHIRIRPQMYFSNDVPAVQNWLYGFEAACRLFDVRIWDEAWKIYDERGWDNGAMHPVQKMIEKGLSEDEVILEVFSVLILALQRKYPFGEEIVVKFHEEMRQNIEKTRQEIANPKGEFNVYRNEAVAQAERDRIEQTLKKLDSIERVTGLKTGN
ncbi:MAG: hypothetical protein ABI690_10465 [Chloroflexota bacterium]